MIHSGVCNTNQRLSRVQLFLPCCCIHFGWSPDLLSSRQSSGTWKHFGKSRFASGLKGLREVCTWSCLDWSQAEGPSGSELEDRECLRILQHLLLENFLTDRRRELLQPKPMFCHRVTAMSCRPVPLSQSRYFARRRLVSAFALFSQKVFKWKQNPGESLPDNWKILT